MSKDKEFEAGAVGKKLKLRTGSAFELEKYNSKLLPDRLLAIDPGTRHCGMAVFHLDKAIITAGTGAIPWVLDQTLDAPPLGCLDFVQSWLREGGVGQLVVEGYQLYPNMMQQQGLSRMGTPEIIGALKYIYFNTIGRNVWECRFNEQGASIKSPGRRYMDENKIEEVGTNPHKRDAEAHGWYRIKVLEAERKKIK